MVFKISQVIELPVIPVVSQREPKAFHLCDKIVIDDPPLPNVMNISICAFLSVLWAWMNFIHFLEHSFVGFFILRMRNVLKIFLLAEIKQSDGAIRSNKLRIKD